jgi:endonuclease/exonuclease/phosphatase family metal-dependent hydrolase
MKLLLAVIALTLALTNGAPRAAPEKLKVCSFNVQIFGANKAKNDEVMEILGNIFRQYDLCLIQEIRDTKDDSIKQLLAKINGKSDNFRMIVSDRLGRSNSKEQYGFFYNKNKIQVTDSFHFDAAKDLFERPPFVVRFKASNAPVTDFFIAGIHTNPGAAKEEVGSLVKVYDDAAKRFKIQDGIIMGDFNADCSYFAKKYWKENALRSDKRFNWLIGDDENTTVGKQSCAYDRVVVAGSTMQKYATSARTYYYDEEYNTDIDTVRLVSDHYPIDFTIG